MSEERHRAIPWLSLLCAVAGKVLSNVRSPSPPEHGVCTSDGPLQLQTQTQATTFSQYLQLPHCAECRKAGRWSPTEERLVKTKAWSASASQPHSPHSLGPGWLQVIKHRAHRAGDRDSTEKGGQGRREGKNGENWWRHLFYSKNLVIAKKIIYTYITSNDSVAQFSTPDGSERVGQNAEDAPSQALGFLFDILGFYDWDVQNHLRLCKNSKLKKKKKKP